jgi:hypothetical protein
MMKAQKQLIDNDEESMSSIESVARPANDLNGSSNEFPGPEPITDITRDEMEGVRKLIDTENKVVQLWRAIVAIMLLSTASLVTYFTYKFLINEEQRNFEVGVSCNEYCYDVQEYAYVVSHLSALVLDSSERYHPPLLTLFREVWMSCRTSTESSLHLLPHMHWEPVRHGRT